MDACNEYEVHFTCTVNKTELQWRIDFSRGPEISDIMARYFSNDIIGSRRDVVTKRATAYTFNLISMTPLTSTMTANASRDLNEAIVICQDGFTDAALKDTIAIHGN